MDSQKKNSNFSNITYTILLIISIIILFISFYYGQFSTPNSSPTFISSSSILNVSINSEVNLNFFIDLINNSRKSILIVISLTKNHSILPPKLINALNEALKRQIIIKIYTNSDLFDNFSLIQIKKFNSDSIKMKINFALIDNLQSFYPSSFFTNEINILTYYVYYSNSYSVYYHLYQFFDYLWTLPINGKHYINKYSWVIYSPISKNSNFTWEPNSIYPLDHPSLTNLINLALDDSADNKIFLSSSIFPSKISEKYSPLQSFYLSLLENQPFYEKFMSILIPSDHFLKNLNGFKSLLTSRNSDSTFELRNCSYHIDGTLIIVSDQIIFFPTGYDEAFSEKFLFIGFNILDKSSYFILKNYLDLNLISKCTLRKKPEIKIV